MLLMNSCSQQLRRQRQQQAATPTEATAAAAAVVAANIKLSAHLKWVYLRVCVCVSHMQMPVKCSLSGRLLAVGVASSMQHAAQPCSVLFELFIF